MAISAAAVAIPFQSHAEPLKTWQGTALGAHATLRLACPDAKAIAKQVASEISRLEDIFSLYRLDSAVPRLNRSGSLANPPFELLDVFRWQGPFTGRARDGSTQPFSRFGPAKPTRLRWERRPRQKHFKPRVT